MLATPPRNPTIALRGATAADREAIYRIRHDVYAAELGQHPANADGRLTDSLDAFNTYLVAEVESHIAGFLSITPPGGPTYSIDKYFPRHTLPFPFDDGLFEFRLLTVVRSHRRGPVAPLLMRAALQWVRQRGGTRIVIIGRSELLGLYRKVGFQALGLTARSGALTFELMSARVSDLERAEHAHAPLAASLDRLVRPPSLVPAASPEASETRCEHGGAFFDAIGDEFDRLDTADRIINADVLDAWFPPAPAVVAAMQSRLPWLLATSPPVGCGGFLRAISRARGVPPECLVPGAGSSALIFLAFRRWLSASSRVLVLDPMYGEYNHLLRHIVGCRVDTLPLDAASAFRLDPQALARAAEANYDLIVLVNPNNPTGHHVPRSILEPLLTAIPRRTRIWMDETYIDYAGPDQSLEPLAAAGPNFVICKSLSKVLALSGARAAYLCASPEIAADLRSVTPPWAISLPAQVAAVAALGCPEYYQARCLETHHLRGALASMLESIGLQPIRGVINSVLARLPDSAPTAAEVVAACREQGVFVRDCATISPLLSPRFIRVAVKDARATACIASALRAALGVAPPC